MKRILTFCLVIMLLFTALSFPADATTENQPTDFPDYNENAWWSDAITFCIKNNIFQGTDKRLLEPNRTITRAELIACIVRSFGCYKETDITKFTDVSKDDWFYSEVAMGVQMGIINGVSEFHYDPYSHVTREQTMSIIARTLALLPGKIEDLQHFRDADTTSAWAIPEVAALYNDGRVEGYPENILCPTKDITRAEVATLLYKTFSIITEETDLQNLSTDKITVIRAKNHDVIIDNSAFDGILLIAPSIADCNVTIKNSNINKLLCWGASHVYIKPDTSVNAIKISRTDGPCTIIWENSITELPANIQIDQNAYDGKIISKDGQLIIDRDSTIHITGIMQDDNGITLKNATVTITNKETGSTITLTADENGHFDTGNIPYGIYEVQAQYTLANQTYYSDPIIITTITDNLTITIHLNNSIPSGDYGEHIVDTNKYVTINPQNGNPTFKIAIQNNHITQPDDPVKNGYIFGGWYENPESGYRYDFAFDTAYENMMLYAKWYTPEEWAIIQAMNQTISDSNLNVIIDTDILALVGKTNVPCQIQNTNNTEITIEIINTHNNTTYAIIPNIAPGQSITSFELLKPMDYGNYEITFKITAANGTTVNILGMLYIAYLW